MPWFQTCWDQVKGVPDCGRCRPQQPPFPRKFLRQACSTSHRFPCVLPTVNPGLVNNNYAPPQLPCSHRGSLSSDVRLDSVLSRVFEVPPSQMDWYHRDGTLSWRPFYGATPSVHLPISDMHPSHVCPQSFPLAGPVAPPVPQFYHFHSDQTISLHHLLTCNFDSSRSLRLKFDISQPPTDARVRAGSLSYVPLPVDQIPITSLLPSSSRRCVLSFENEILENYVLKTPNISLVEFLWELHNHLQESLSTGELGRIQNLPLQYDSAVMAMERRCSGTLDPERERSRGIKRIDCLDRRTWFEGMFLVFEDGQQQNDVVLGVSFMEQI